MGGARSVTRLRVEPRGPSLAVCQGLSGPWGSYGAVISFERGSRGSGGIWQLLAEDRDSFRGGFFWGGESMSLDAADQTGVGCSQHFSSEPGCHCHKSPAAAPLSLSWNLCR